VLEGGVKCIFECFQLTQVSLYLLCESVLGTVANFVGSDGDGHYEVLSSLYPRPVRLLLWCV